MRPTTFLLPLLLLITAGAALPQVPGATEFPIDFPASSFDDVDLARNPAGELVVVWCQGPTISAQRYSPDGEALGDRVQLDAPGFAPGVVATAIDGAGRFVIVTPTLSGEESIVRVWLFDGDGSLLRQLDVARLGGAGERSDLRATDVAMDAAGDFVVSWWQNDRVLVRFYEADGDPRGAALDLGVGASTGASVATNAAGDVVVVWSRDNDVWGRRFAVTGEARGGELRLNAETLPSFVRPDVGVDADGGFLAVWARVETGQNDLVLARRFDASGQPLGDAMTVAEEELAGLPFRPLWPRVAVAPSGEALVLWLMDRGTDNDLDGVAKGRFLPGGEPPGGGPPGGGPPSVGLPTNAFLVSRIGRRRPPVAASDAAGDFAVAYEISRNQPTGFRGLFGRLLPSGGHGILELVDDPVLPFSEVVEDGLVVGVGVLRTGGLQGEVSVGFEAIPSGARPATAGEDFSLASGRLVFAEGESFKTIPLEIFEDELLEGKETLTLRLEDADGGVAVLTPEATVTIVDDDLLRPGDGPSRLGGQLHVEDSPGFQARRPRLAVGTSGDFLLTWLSAPRASDPWRLRAQLFDAGLEPKSEAVDLADVVEFEVTTATALPQGEFFVTWELPGEGVFGRRVVPRDGVLELGEEILLARCIHGILGNCHRFFRHDVAADPAGRLVMSWVSRDVPLIRRFDSSGSPLPVASFFGRFGDTAVAAAPSGEILYVFANAGLEANRIDVDGNPRGRTRLVDRGSLADAAARPGGGWVVTWQEETDPPFFDLSGIVGLPVSTDVYARTVGADGEAGDLLEVNVFTARAQHEPRVAAARDGDFAVAWTSEGELGVGRSDVFVQRYDADGRVVGGRFPVGPMPGASIPGPPSSSPDLVADGAGDFVVAWESQVAPDDYDIFAQRFSGAGCAGRPERLCLGEGRFELEVDWRAPDGRTGRGRVVRLTEDTGGFWFFSEENVELIVKVLDGRQLNGRFWVFYGALSNVEFTLKVRDTLTGASKTYANPQGRFASVGDTGALPGDGIRQPSGAMTKATPKAGCADGSETTLCLGDDRFRLEVDWEDPRGQRGTGHPVPLTGDTGAFWFFNDENIELIVKVLDARNINGHFWVFYGSLSNVEFTLRVEDTVTGATKSYVNRQGSFASVGDVTALPGGS